MKTTPMLLTACLTLVVCVETVEAQCKNEVTARVNARTGAVLYDAECVVDGGTVVVIAEGVNPFTQEVIINGIIQRVDSGTPQVPTDLLLAEPLKTPELDGLGNATGPVARAAAFSVHQVSAPSSFLQEALDEFIHRYRELQRSRAFIRDVDDLVFALGSDVRRALLSREKLLQEAAALIEPKVGDTPTSNRVLDWGNGGLAAVDTALSEIDLAYDALPREHKDQYIQSWHRVESFKTWYQANRDQVAARYRVVSDMFVWLEKPDYWSVQRSFRNLDGDLLEATTLIRQRSAAVKASDPSTAVSAGTSSSLGLTPAGSAGSAVLIANRSEIRRSAVSQIDSVEALVRVPIIGGWVVSGSAGATVNWVVDHVYRAIEESDGVVRIQDGVRASNVRPLFVTFVNIYKERYRRPQFGPMIGWGVGQGSRYHVFFGGNIVFGHAQVWTVAAGTSISKVSRLADGRRVGDEVSSAGIQRTTSQWAAGLFVGITYTPWRPYKTIRGGTATDAR